MKQTFKLTITVCIALISYTLQAHAQDVTLSRNYSNTDVADLVASLNTQTNKLNSTTDVDAKVIHAFDKWFNSAENVTWSLAKKGYLVRFDWNGIESYALYNKNGYKFYDIHFGKDNNLPAEIRDIVKLKYKNGQVYGTIEINTDYQNAWVINLKDADNLVVALVKDNNVDEFSSVKMHQQTKKTKKARIVIPNEH